MKKNERAIDADGSTTVSTPRADVTMPKVERSGVEAILHVVYPPRNA